MKHVLLFIGLIAIILGVVYASNYDFLVEAPITYFTAEDTALFTQANRKAIHAHDGARINWNNPETGAWGYILPFGTHSEDGVTCRYFKIYNNARERSGISSFKICKFPFGWREV